MNQCWVEAVPCSQERRMGAPPSPNFGAELTFHLPTTETTREEARRWIASLFRPWRLDKSLSSRNSRRLAQSQLGASVLIVALRISYFPLAFDHLILFAASEMRVRLRDTRSIAS